ncbi:MAG: carboxymuconolactone decarboxylase family protein [Thermoflexales bacterium]|nr:carboxymuconolactone decarboxylase family protein [Thermoflexales bacterium]MCS7325615.1 carboxymuconolactone decarboxylase family protein [Thermoflexales bacterium]MCX7938897.1 carboxymuconolactone decarboxylase family protein [Thermoflexales bacterium]MDW8054366.1 carboxymuconolactone decarboxylase family protein [Anaerolineae bacterium]MDW8291472.1 carboxymuconolactone decarboxylase family protein [Anaerolineae bacterium]
MSRLIEYEEANDEVRAVYDDIRATRKSDYINNFWKALAVHPPTLKRVWTIVKGVMAEPGALDPLTRQLIYLAVSITNGCEYCMASHAAAARALGMTDAMYAELAAIVGVANMTNRLADAFHVPVDEVFKQG